MSRRKPLRILEYPRLGAATTTFGLAVATSYAIQRLSTWLWGETSPEVVVAQEHIPYYWRVSLAFLHGVVAIALVWPLVRDRHSARAVYRAIPWVTAGLIPLWIAAMVAVP